MFVVTYVDVDVVIVINIIIFIVVTVTVVVVVVPSAITKTLHRGYSDPQPSQNTNNKSNNNTK